MKQPSDKELMRDEQLVEELLGRSNKEAYIKHLEQSTRNLSVDVHTAIQKRTARPRTSRVVLSVLGLATAVVCVLFFVPWQANEPVVIAGGSSIEVGVQPEAQTELDIVDEMIDEASVGHLAVVTDMQSSIVSDEDVDQLLESLE